MRIWDIRYGIFCGSFLSSLPLFISLIRSVCLWECNDYLISILLMYVVNFLPSLLCARIGQLSNRRSVDEGFVQLAMS